MGSKLDPIEKLQRVFERQVYECGDVLFERFADRTSRRNILHLAVDHALREAEVVRRMLELMRNHDPSRTTVLELLRRAQKEIEEEWQL